ncbi:hypothetical protein [Chryseobacterium sp. G0240]|uniref:hypothetical protein n=1 Tax=Chryseobacterium sp. G0240 TaxID=2487066 RepID=UPI00160C0559|nr:hypothetical protein [Chryseobacterium sp. G0240]
MKKSGLVLVLFVLLTQLLWGQKIPEGKIVTTYITAKTLQNKAGENPKRRV